MSELIERLLAEETDLTDCAVDHIEQTEAKLAKAVETLREITGRHIPDCFASFGGDELEWAVRQHTALRATARTTLAELEGKE